MTAVADQDYLHETREPTGSEESRWRTLGSAPPPLSAFLSKQAGLGWLMNGGSRVLFNKGVLEFYLIGGFLSSIQIRRAHPASRLTRPRARRCPPLLVRHAHPAQVELLLLKFHRNRTRKYYNTALFVCGCWVSLTGRFHRHSAAGWAECTAAGPGRVRSHAALGLVALLGICGRVAPMTIQFRLPCPARKRKPLGCGGPWPRVSHAPTPTQKLIALRPSNYVCACCQSGL